MYPRAVGASYEAVANNLPGGVVYCSVARPDGQLEFVWAGDGVEAMFHVSREDILADASALMRHIHPDDEPERMRRQERSATQLTPFDQVIRFDLPVGLRWIHVRAMPRAADDGCVFWDGVALDVTAEREAAQRERLATARYRATMDHVADAVLTVDLGALITLLNPAAERLLGQSEAALLGQSCSLAARLVDEDTGAELPCPVEPALLSAEPCATPGRAMLVRPDGTRVPVRGVARRIGGTDGQPVEGAVITLRDITAERAGIAAALRAQKLESLGVLAAGVAHDLNNLLTPILLASEAIRPLLLGDVDALDALAQSEHAALRASELTRQLLVSAAQVPTVVEPVELGPVVRELVAQAPASARIELVLPGSLPPIHADRAQVRQLVRNLLTNACEALVGEAGHIRIEAAEVVATEDMLRSPYVVPSPPPGDYVALRITDAGIGIAAENLDRVFDPFFSTKFTGRGLGLAAVLGIVRAHHGTVTLSSEVGAGTRIEVLLPRAEAPPPAPLATPTAALHLTGTVLLVDDEPALRRTVERTLRRAGLTVLTAGDGLEGLEVFTAHAHAIDLVMLDLTMPRLDGAGMLRELRRLAPTQPVILMSGYATDAVVASLGDLQVQGTLQKPFGVQPLLATIARCLAARR